MKSNTTSLNYCDELPGVDLLDAGDLYDLQREILQSVGDALDRLLACNNLPKAIPGGCFGFTIEEVCGDKLDHLN